LVRLLTNGKLTCVSYTRKVMNRRDLLCLISSLPLSKLMPAALFDELIKPASAADEPYRSDLVLDCNSAPPWEQGHLPLPVSDLDMVRDCGVNIIKLTLGGINEDLTETVKEIGYVHQMIEIHQEYFLQVRVSADMQRAKHERKLGMILSFESVDMLEGKLDRLEIFRNFGIRGMQLSYNRKSPFGAGVMEPNGGGLTALGKEAVKRMNSLGITIDLSHANSQTTEDVLDASPKPVIMSHAGCAAVHPHPRNKTDEQLRALASHGGVIGIYDLPYLTASPTQPTADDYMRHLEHALKIAGEDHVGIGSDVSIKPFDTSAESIAEFKKIEEERQKAGVAAPEEDRPNYVEGLNVIRRTEVIGDQLRKRGYSSNVITKVFGANFARVFSESWQP
jgi:membrane dipeptidase